MKTLLALCLLVLLSACSPKQSHNTIIFQAEEARYMANDNDTVGYEKWMNETATVRELAFQTSCQVRRDFPDCRTKHDDFEY